MLIPRPGPDEYVPYFGTYVNKVPAGDILEVLEAQRVETQRLLRSLTPAQALHRYAPGKWSIKEVVGHVADAERVFAYRALRFARGDETPLASFDENKWMPFCNFDARSMSDLADELDLVRRATLALFRSFDGPAIGRRGLANGNGVSVRAVAYIIAGHERHHVDILRERYLGGRT
jgi:hypothetical protein